MSSDPFDYIESRADADELIADFGAPCALRRATVSGPAWEPVQTTTDYATAAAVIDYSAYQRTDASILVNDRRALVAAGPLTALGITAILPGDIMVIGDMEFPVVISKPVNPAGIVVLHDVQLRF